MTDSSRILFVAAGGGGDALAALMLADAAGLAPRQTVVASFAWERTMFDPRPGPRPPEHFSGLRRWGRHNWLVTPSSRLRPPHAVSFLPRLAREHDSQVLLLDASCGVAGLRQQLIEAMELTRAQRCVLVDVGGDILARGDEKGLKSPTADAMVLAAAADVAQDSIAVVLGLGLDGEGGAQTLPAQLHDRGTVRCDLPPSLPSRTARRFGASFRWSPSEATGLTYMVARGWRGKAEIRRDGTVVTLSARAASILVFSCETLLEQSPIAQKMLEAATFEEVEAVVRAFGLTVERDVERVARRSTHSDTPDVHRLTQLENRLVAYSTEAVSRDIDYLTLRRVAEILQLTAAELEALVTFVIRRHGARCRPPVWMVQQPDFDAPSP